MVYRNRSNFNQSNIGGRLPINDMYIDDDYIDDDYF